MTSIEELADEFSIESGVHKGYLCKYCGIRNPKPSCKKCHEIRKITRLTKKLWRESSKRCEACGTNELPKTHKNHTLDHNHKTMKLRGILCVNCNAALGLAGDNPKLLLRLADYLIKKSYAPTRSVIR